MATARFLAPDFPRFPRPNVYGFAEIALRETRNAAAATLTRKRRDENIFSALLWAMRKKRKKLEANSRVRKREREEIMINKKEERYIIKIERTMETPNRVFERKV